MSIFRLFVELHRKPGSVSLYTLPKGALQASRVKERLTLPLVWMNPYPARPCQVDRNFQLRHDRYDCHPWVLQCLRTLWLSITAYAPLL